ncbi:MAG: DNA-directed RNA polymerase subunit P [Candidatus Jordarchaeaceae archaeon]
MVYICGKCGRQVTIDSLNLLGGIKCPSCGYRVLYKARPPVVKRVKAR